MGSLRNPEQYGPLLLVSLTRGQKARADWADWLQEDLGRKGWREYRELCGMGSWNHLFMLGGAALWAGVAGAVDFWVGLLRYQLGEAAPPAGQEILGAWEGTEPFAAEYGAFRHGSVAGVRLWALKHGHAELIRLTGAYFDRCAALLALFAVGRPDPVERRGGHGMTYSGPEPSPVGERTNLRKVSPLGPILGLLAGWDGLEIKPAASDWAVDLVAQVVKISKLGAAAVSLGVARAAEAWVRDRNLGALEAIERSLDDVRLCPGADLHAWVFDGSLVTWRDRRTNGNTPGVLGARLDDDATVQVLYPFFGGRNQRAKGGTCEAVQGGDGAWSLVATGEAGERRLEMPAGEPRVQIRLGPGGLEVKT